MLAVSLNMIKEFAKKEEGGRSGLDMGTRDFEDSGGADGDVSDLAEGSIVSRTLLRSRIVPADILLARTMPPSLLYPSSQPT